jgi:proline dehydrogenase
MLRSALVAASRSAALEKFVSQSPLSRGVVQRFVAGTGTADAIATVTALREKGIYSTVDRLGEDTQDRAAAQGTVDAYLELLHAIGQAGLGEWAEVSVKLSAVGQALVDGGEALALENALTICRLANEVGTTVTFDMEDHTTIDSTLRILHDVRNHFPSTGGVLQAQLYRTEEDVAAHAYAGSRIRLCKGAYAEEQDVAFIERLDIDKSFVRCMRILLDSQSYPMLATHDPRLIQIGQALALRTARQKDSYEFQMLLGVRPDEQERLVQLGYKVRVYVPYGDQWYPYLMRRMAEKPANLALFLRSLVSRS